MNNSNQQLKAMTEQIKSEQDDLLLNDMLETSFFLTGRTMEKAVALGWKFTPFQQITQQELTMCLPLIEANCQIIQFQPSKLQVLAAKQLVVTFREHAATLRRYCLIKPFTKAGPGGTNNG